MFNTYTNVSKSIDGVEKADRIVSRGDILVHDVPEINAGCDITLHDRDHIGS